MSSDRQISIIRNLYPDSISNFASVIKEELSRDFSSDEDFVNIPTFGKSGSEKEVLNFFELDMTDLVIKIKNNL